MTAFLLDTNVIIDAINNKKDRRQFLRDLLKPVTSWPAAQSTWPKSTPE